MNKQIWKSILAGALIGGAFYALPIFFLRGLLVFLVIGFLFRYFFWRGRGWHRRDDINPAFADAIRRMSDEEYDAFKKKFDRHRMSTDDESNKSVHH